MLLCCNALANKSLGVIIARSIRSLGRTGGISSNSTKCRDTIHNHHTSKACHCLQNTLPHPSLTNQSTSCIICIFTPASSMSDMSDMIVVQVVKEELNHKSFCSSKFVQLVWWGQVMQGLKKQTWDPQH
jgi:hypothetical protein